MTTGALGGVAPSPHLVIQPLSHPRNLPLRLSVGRIHAGHTLHRLTYPDRLFKLLAEFHRYSCRIL